MTADEYEAAFHGLELPERVELASGVTVPNVPDFIKREIFILRNNNSERLLDPIRLRLDKLLKIIHGANDTEQTE